MSKICTNCGREVSDTSLFCPACGASLAQQTSLFQQQPAENEYPMNQSPYEPQQSYQPQPQYTQQPQYAQQPQYQPQQYCPATPVKAKTPGRGFGIASMVLGIIAVLNAFSLIMFDLSAGVVTDIDQSITQGAAAYGMKFILTFMIVFVGILTVLSLVFGIVSVVKGYRKTSIAGLIMGGISLVICVVSIFVTVNIKAPSLNELVNSGIGDYNYEYNFDGLDDIDDFNDFYNYFN